MALISLRHIQKDYHMGDTVVSALNGVNLEIEEGDYVAIMGPSGSGKSTLMHVMGLLDSPSDGDYLLEGKPVSHLSEDDLAVLRRHKIGFIFQQFNLLPRMSATDNVALPLLYSKGRPHPDDAHPFLSQVHLTDRASHRPNELSGGQQQRVAIARALINRPRIVFADEPTGNLDSTSELEIMSILKDLNEQGMTVIVVTHEDDIGRQAKRIIRMRDGKIQSDERLAPLTFQTDSHSLESNFHPGWIHTLVPHIEQGIQTLLANKVRTALSMLGILIGVAAVVAMLALGRGAQTAIENQLSSLGSNLLILHSGSMRGPGGAMAASGTTTRVTLDDAQAIQTQIANVKDVSANVSGRGQVTFGNKNWNTSVTGTGPGYARMHNAEPQVGRFFSAEDVQRRMRIAIIGMTLVRELFQGQNPIGEMIKINKISFQVIGILPEKGATGFRDEDDQIIIPVTTGMYRLFGKDYVDMIDIEMQNAQETEKVQDNILDLMLSRHKVPPSQQDEAFRVRNMQDLQNALTSTTKVMTLLLSVIAAISLVVGGIGIMNIMLVSVTERTREIGLRKAVGAKRRDILIQFLVEAIVVSGIGGILGILLAWAITWALSMIAGWATSITVSSMLLAVLFSASIGIIFGIYPARQASRLHPIDALRYE